VAELHELADDTLGKRLVSTRYDEFAIQDVLEEDLAGDLFFGEAFL
jgi:hypothetical protein